jgi:hypothetical protein
MYAWSVLLVEETGENHRPVWSLWQTVSHNVVSSTTNISWWAVLLVEEIGENHRPVASHWQTLSHNDRHLVMGTDYIGSCKSNYHTITTTMAPNLVYKHQTKHINQIFSRHNTGVCYLKMSTYIVSYLIPVSYMHNNHIYNV